jgi:hypothetical protein
MDDMGTPSKNHPAHRGLGKRSEGQFNNVVDLSAERRKRRTDAGDAAYESNMKVLWDKDVNVHDNN